MGDWQETKVGDFLFEREGKYKPDDDKVSCLPRINKIDFSGKFHIGNKDSNTNMILVKSGDLVISGINVAKGAIGIYKGDDATATIHYSSYTFDETKIDPEFLNYFVRSPEFLRLIREQAKGGIKTEIKAKHLLCLKMNLPSTKEQENIVESLKLFESEVDKLGSEITRLQTLLKKLRQQILQEAIEGKLTADWRAKNPDIEPASELLKRITVEKEQLIKEKKIKTQKPLPLIKEEEKPFELPDGWEWCRLGEIGVINPRNRVEDNLIVGFSPMPFISSEFGVHPTYTNRKWLDVKKGFTHFKENDVVIAKITPCFENSKSGVIKDVPNRFGAGTTELYVFRRFGSLLEPSFIYLRCKTTSFLKNGKKVMKGAVGQKRVPKEYVENLLLALPSLSEQKAIVTKVEKLLTLCNQLEEQIASSRTNVQQLMQAVLREVFSQKGN